MQTLKKSAKIARLDGIPIRQEVQKTIDNYRATPHPVTKQTPDHLTFGRELRRKLPERIVPTRKFRVTRSGSGTRQRKNK